MRRLRLFLDANVLVDATARDFFCTLAEIEVVDIRWSDTVLEEVERALVQRLNLRIKDAQKVIGALRRAFP